MSGNSNGMMHMGRMVHADSEMNADSASSTVAAATTDSGCEGENCPDVTSEGLGGLFLNVHPTYKCDKGVNDKVKDPKSCNRFIQCMDGLAYHFACQENLFWSSELKVCTDESAAKCESKPEATEEENSDKADDGLCPSGFEGLIPDETNCRRYISCSENGGFYMKCQTGLVWNKKTNACDWPSEENPGC